MSTLDRLAAIDRRWIFLLMGLAVAVPILVIGLTNKTFPETPTPLAQSVFDAVQDAGEEDRRARVLLAFDFDPASEGELGPMATSFVRHCAELGHQMYFMALWPVGPQMIRKSISDVIETEFPELVEGEDYVNLGFRAGNEAVIKVIVTDFAQQYGNDSRGTPVAEIPMMNGVGSVQDFDLIVNVSAGYPGSKEWVLYAATPYDIPFVTGCTGVQAPQLYPYVPNQIDGLLGAIKGAAEYESLVNDWVREHRVTEALEASGVSPGEAATLAARFIEEPALVENESRLGPTERARVVNALAPTPGRFIEGQRRMGPQLIAHLLMVGLIVAGNVIFFLQRRRGRVA